MILVLYNIILITNFKLIEMCIKSSPQREGSEYRVIPICQITLGGDKTKNKQNVGYLGAYSPPFGLLFIHIF